MRKKKFLSVLMAGALLLGLVGCGEESAGSTVATAAPTEAAVTAAPTETEAARDNSVTAFVGTTIFEESLDPIKGGMSYGYPFINNALVRVNPDSQYVGDLATDWTVSEDGLTYTFNLRQGVTFSDGSPFTAEDVVFTYETVMANPANNENVDLSCLESVKAEGDNQVIFQLKTAY